jgi:hypothetical protein
MSVKQDGNTLHQQNGSYFEEDSLCGCRDVMSVSDPKKK